MSEHKSELGHELTKALHSAKSFQKELSLMRPASSGKITISVAGTIGGSEISACTVVFNGDTLEDTIQLAGEFEQGHKGAVCQSTGETQITCTL